MLGVLGVVVVVVVAITAVVALLSALAIAGRAMVYSTQRASRMTKFKAVVHLAELSALRQSGLQVHLNSLPSKGLASKFVDNVRAAVFFKVGFWFLVPILWGPILS